jgi:hypothetical protein
MVHRQIIVKRSLEYGGLEAQRLDGVELRTDRWRVDPVEVRAVRSSFFDDPHRFPAGSAVLDCALPMRDAPATWSALELMRVV